MVTFELTEEEQAHVKRLRTLMDELNALQKEDAFDAAEFYESGEVLELTMAGQDYVPQLMEFESVLPSAFNIMFDREHGRFVTRDEMESKRFDR